jgi:hypothetical protein
MAYDSRAVLVVSVHLAGGKMPTNSFLSITCNTGVWKILKKKEFLVWCDLLLLHEYLYFSRMKSSTTQATHSGTIIERERIHPDSDRDKLWPLKIKL